MRYCVVIFLSMICVSLFGQRDLKEGMRAVEKDSKWGFMNEQGKLVIPYMYEAADDFSEGIATAKKDGKVGYIDKTNKVVIPFTFTGAIPFSGGVAMVVMQTGPTSGKFWMIDKTGAQVSPQTYDGIHFLSDERYGITMKDKKYGLLYRNGKEMLPPVYDKVQPVFNQLIGVQKDGKWGFADTLNRLVVPLEYEEVGIFEKGVAEATKNGKKGLLDLKGNTVLAFNYLDIYPDEATGWVRVKNFEKKWGVVDYSGKQIVPFVHGFINKFDEIAKGYAWTSEKNLESVIDKNGKVIVPLKYQKIYAPFNGNCIVISPDGLFGVVELASGKELIRPIYRLLKHPEDKGPFAARKEDITSHGYVDINGKEITTFTYYDARPFSEGMAAVRFGKTNPDGSNPRLVWGYINTSGSVAIPLEYEYAYEFSNGKARVVKDKKSFFIDKTGNKVN